MRTTNGLERLNKEIQRRTRVATLFPNEASLLRLASAVLSEISDDRAASVSVRLMKTISAITNDRTSLWLGLLDAVDPSALSGRPVRKNPSPQRVSLPG